MNENSAVVLEILKLALVMPAERDARHRSDQYTG